MALSVTVDLHEHVGRKRFKYVTLAFDSVYPTGGEAVLPAKFGLGRVDFAFFNPRAGYIFEYDYTNDKVLVYWTDLSASSDSALVEVTASTDLATLTGVRGLIVGS